MRSIFIGFAGAILLHLNNVEFTWNVFFSWLLIYFIGYHFVKDILEELEDED